MILNFYMINLWSMLHSISIKNFKKISDLGITPNNLTDINYLVGENWCGKSSVLEALEEVSTYSWIHNVLWWEKRLINSKNFLSYPDRSDTDIRILLDQGEKQIVNGDTNYDGIFGVTRKNWSDQIRYHWNQKLSPIVKYIKYDIKIDRDAERIIKIFEKYMNKQDIEHFCILFFGHWLPVKISEYQTSFQWYDIALMNQRRKSTMNHIAMGTIEIRLLIQNIYDIAIGEDKYNDVIVFGDWESWSQIIIIEEPESHLHPRFQKFIPQIIDIFNKHYKGKFQFFISTHSPFIISASAELDNQKVYLLKDGQTIDLIWDLWSASSQDWYMWYECKKLINEMLGVWFDDFQNKIILCEWTINWKWEKYIFDERIYSIIFPNLWYTFISSWGGDMKLNIYVAKKIFEEWIYCMIKDSDSKLQEIKNKEVKEYETNWILLKYLNRCDLESYLLDFVVIQKYFKLQWFSLTRDFKTEFEKCDIKIHLNRGHENSKIILKLIGKQLFSESNEKIKNLSKDLIYCELAKVIYNHKSIVWPIHDIYNELYQSVF